ncbi:DUF3088 family protein [Alteromonadaceae bacterium M269]|nr:DUF3088 family protein [Alteromonadaceae bacterium M269]
MSKPSTLYLFKTNFKDAAYPGKAFFCPFCIQVEGLLAAFPEIRQDLDIRYVDFEKPRADLPELSGEANQSCPQLILPEGDDEFSAQYSIDGIGNVRRIEKTLFILDYLAERYGTSERH